MSVQIQKRTQSQVGRYRGRIGIIADIFEILMEHGKNGAMVSVIARKANLSHYAVIAECQRLGNAGLVESVTTKRNRIFRTSEEGVRFFFEFQRFVTLVQTMNLRY